MVTTHFWWLPPIYGDGDDYLMIIQIYQKTSNNHEATSPIDPPKKPLLLQDPFGTDIQQFFIGPHLQQLRTHLVPRLTWGLQGKPRGNLCFKPLNVCGNMGIVNPKPDWNSLHVHWKTLTTSKFTSKSAANDAD
jgi:hypothetical protein